jgi:glycine betaine/proline transport system permease protein
VSTVITAQENGPAPWHENEFLDEYEVPFGSWIDSIVDWVDQNLGESSSIDFLAKIESPFSFMFRNFVDGATGEAWWKITETPWWVVCLLFLVLGTLIRNVRVGVASGLALFVCGLLGTEYWDETSLTLGLIIVAVAMCALIGIPVGVLCGRVDSVWEVVRPILDAMQVVHAFVYMLPIIFFFGLGNEPATIVTMVFAIPPLIRLTNLGVRQVPEDVVEASRAYGAPEWRVLLDVQLPLARQAIMTGLNQTLLLSISMLGIAALMGAGGLGKLVFQAVTQVSVPKAASSGLALFMVAVVLDRVTQPAVSDGKNLISRIVDAWGARRNPEVLLAEQGAKEEEETTIAVGAAVPLTSRERLGAQITAAAGLTSIIAVLLSWSEGPGRIAAWSRRSDEALTDSFSGIAASGGSWYGIIVAGCGVLALLSAVAWLTMPQRASRSLGPHTAAISGAVALGTTLSFIMISSPAQLFTEPSLGIGATLAVITSVAMLIGSALWLFGANYVANTPLKSKVAYGRIVIAGLAVLWAVLGGMATWSQDGRQDIVITPEIQAEMDFLEAQADNGELDARIAATRIAGLFNSARQNEPVLFNGFETGGPDISTLIVVLSGVGLLTTLGAAGLFGLEEVTRWRWNVLTAGVGGAIMALSLAWVISTLRTADPNYVSGPGALLAIVTGVVFISGTKSTLSLFGRSKVFADDESIDDLESNASDPEPSLAGV